MSRLLFWSFDVAGGGGTGIPTVVVGPSNTAPTSLGGRGLSLVIDPISRDLIDTPDGWFLESTDSRTAVMWQLESNYQAWWADAFSGSRIRAIIGGNEPANAQDLRDEVLRALQQLVADGLISDLAVVLDRDEAGRLACVLNYRDRASGQPVDLAFVPFGG